MNVQKYIASGILEQYALDTLSEEERREVMANATQYPEIHAEIEAIEAALETYAMLNAVAPPVELKATILQKIDSTSNPSSRLLDKEKFNKPPKSGGGMGKLLFWLPLILLPLLLLTGIWGYMQNQSRKKEQETRLEHGKRLTDCDTERKNLRGTIKFYREAIRFVNDKNTRAIAMTGNEKLPGASTTIHTNSAFRITYFAINDLPEPPEGKQYQLWAIIDGKPESLEVFDISLDPIEVGYRSEVEAYAISLEEKGGVAVPTDVRVVGAVKS